MPVLVDDSKEWGDWGGLERIDINVDDPVEVDSTCQFFAHNNSWVQYQVDTEIERRDEHVVLYRIRYTAENNTHLLHPTGQYQQKGFTWGIHTLILQNNEASGESKWTRENYPEMDGPGWKLEQLIGEKRRITTTKLQREQDRFRKMLLATDHCCALTGETCEEALEAAHIVPVKYGGQEVLPNGILLRADLHLIFDAHHFDICPDTGQILIHQPYGSFDDLANSQIPEDICHRIAKALQKRAELL